MLLRYRDGWRSNRNSLVAGVVEQLCEKGITAREESVKS